MHFNPSFSVARKRSSFISHVERSDDNLDGMAHERQFSIVELNDLVWPASLPLPSKRFRLFVAADTTQVPTKIMVSFAEAALSRGMVYFCAWGPGCKRFHDIVDDAVIADDRGQRRFAPPSLGDVVMTTWHNRERLEEALDFFMTWAVPTDGYVAESGYWLVFCLSNPDWASTATRFLKAANP